jgi:hypothetical protein
MKLIDYRTRRYIRYCYLKTLSVFAMKNRNEDRVRRPKHINELQRMAIDISVKLMVNPSSKLYYDLTTQECYVKNEFDGGNVYVFIESNNVKIINTVFGYDIPMTQDGEQYLISVFRREMSKRRSQFKKEALAKVDFSLHTVLDRINGKI